jgi:hypothetical protein
MTTITSAIRWDPPITNIVKLPLLPPIGNIVSWIGESISLVVLPKGWLCEGGKRLKSVLLVQIKISLDGVLASTYLEAEEYGAGDNYTEAIRDLLTSLVEYLESLQSRKEKLGDSALRDLNRLEQLFESSND